MPLPGLTMKRSISSHKWRKPRNPKLLKKLALSILITILAAILYSMISGHTQEARQRVQLQQTFIQLQQSKKTLQQTQTTDRAKQKQIDDLNKKLQETQQQLEAKRSAAVAYAAVVPDPPAPIQPSPAGDDKAFIYHHESGNSPGAVNSIGCRGLGQACPGSKLPCGDDYACQDAWFTNYAMERYGSWAAARAFWENHRWW